jgi:hypothetical protein
MEGEDAGTIRRRGYSFDEDAAVMRRRACCCVEDERKLN